MKTSASSMSSTVSQLMARLNILVRLVSTSSGVAPMSLGVSTISGRFVKAAMHSVCLSVGSSLRWCPGISYRQYRFCLHLVGREGGRSNHFLCLSQNQRTTYFSGLLLHVDHGERSSSQVTSVYFYARCP